MNLLPPPYKNNPIRNNENELAVKVHNMVLEYYLSRYDGYKNWEKIATENILDLLDENKEINEIAVSNFIKQNKNLFFDEDLYKEALEYTANKYDFELDLTKVDLPFSDNLYQKFFDYEQTYGGVDLSKGVHDKEYWKNTANPIAEYDKIIQATFPNDNKQHTFLHDYFLELLNPNYTQEEKYDNSEEVINEYPEIANISEQMINLITFSRGTLKFAIANQDKLPIIKQDANAADVAGNTNKYEMLKGVCKTCFPVCPESPVTHLEHCRLAAINGIAATTHVSVWAGFKATVKFVVKEIIK